MAEWVSRAYRWLLIFRKTMRYASIYGVPKTLFKAMGRSRWGFVRFLTRDATIQDIGIIGCGQFACAMIGFSINAAFGRRFLSCFDVSEENAASFARIYRAKTALSASDVIADPRTKVIYIASNHASHADYAIEALRAGKVVYIEKPIAVNWRQLIRLVRAYKVHPERVFAGYNRPFSPAVCELRQLVQKKASPLTLCCFVGGHMIDQDHWYRQPEEGSRICGNLGHWIDLMVHLIGHNEVPDRWTLTMCWSNTKARSDDFTLVAVSTRGDLVTIVFTSRSEPFEGVSETINLQCGDVIARIDDFRAMTVWNGHQVSHYQYSPKDVGHERAILQPFDAPARNWREVEFSTVLMLVVSDMAEAGVVRREFSFSDEWQRISNEVEVALGE